MLDLTILASFGPHDVLRQHITVQWRDGTSLTLHWVAIHGNPAAALRAHCHDGLHWVVVDVTRLGCDSLAADLAGLHRRDADAVIAWRLCHTHPTADAVAALALQVREAAWTITPRVPA